MPHSTFNERKYEKAEGITLKAMHQLKRTKLPSFFDKISFGQSQIHRIMMTVNPSPTGKKITINYLGISPKKHGQLVSKITTWLAFSSNFNRKMALC